MTRLSEIGVGPDHDRLWKHPSCRVCGVARFDKSRVIVAEVCAHCRGADKQRPKPEQLTPTDRYTAPTGYPSDWGLEGTESAE